MSKLLPIVIVLVLAASSHALFLRPWNNQTWVATNPNIAFYGAWYWWNLPALHTTLDGLNTVGAGTMDLPSAVQSDVEEAADSYLEASERKNICTLSLELAGYMDPGPGFEFLIIFSDITGCRSYERSWKSTVSSSLSAVEKSLLESKQSIRNARTAYDEIVFMGLCEGNYSEDGSEKCPGLRSAFVAVDNNLSEGRYGKYAMLLDKEAELKQNLHDPAPDLSPWSSMLELVFGDTGVVETFDDIRAEAYSVKNLSEAAFGRLMDDASIKKTESEMRLDVLDEQKFFLIGTAPSGYGVSEVGSIHERLEEIKEEKGSIDMLFKEAKALKGRTGQRGYMAMAVGSMSEAAAGYSEVADAVESLEDDAEEAASQKKEEAEQEISNTRRSFATTPGGTDAMQMLEDAEAALEKGNAATLLGTRFAFYAQAASLARAAGDAATMEAETGASSTLALLAETIPKAEKDGIDVTEEKEILRLASALPPAQAEEAAQGAIDAIIFKAQAMYGSEILSSRGRIYDKLSLAGPAAADLYTDMEHLESNLISYDAITFPYAIGSLSNLMEGYSIIEEELDQYMSTIVGNSMASSAMPLVAPVKLDALSDITVDAVLTNPRPYGAETVSATINTGSSFNFLYSDITAGKTDVISVRDAEGGVILVFSSVQPFETKRVVFEKQDVIARTLGRTVAADGLGDGRALVTEQTKFELDFDIQSMELPDHCDEALIDGLPAARPLEKGEHAFSCEYLAADAYDEEIANFRSYPVTMMSRVEFDIRISPNMDLDTVPILVEGMDESAVSKFKITPVTGARVKDVAMISDTQYSATAYNLEKDNLAVLRVSYSIDDTVSYVQSQLSILQSGNLSEEAQTLVEQAAWQAEAANHSKALELISQAFAIAKADEKKDSKLREKKEDLLSKAHTELDEIESALSISLSNSSLSSRLSSREHELSLVIEEAEAQSLAEAVDTLEKLDLKWLDKEMTSFKKESYKSYNDLKERFYLAGNATTPDEFMRFEEALQKLSTGGRLEYAIEASESLEAVGRLVAFQETSKSSQGSMLLSALESLESETLEVMDHYLREASAAKGTDYSSYFTISESKVERIIKDAKTDLQKSGTTSKMEELNQTKEKMELTLASLAEESDAKISILSALIGEEEVPEGLRSDHMAQLSSVRHFAETGEYVNSLRAGSGLAKELESGSAPSNDGLLVLGLTAMAMLAAAGFYMFKQQKPKELRKLPSAKDLPTSSPLSPPSAPPSQSRTPQKPESGSSPAPR